MINFEPKTKGVFLACFLIKSKAKFGIADIRLIPTPKYKRACDGVKNVSGVRSKCDVISQLAPHIDKAAPISAIKNSVMGSFFVDDDNDLPSSLDIFNSLTKFLDDKIVS
jgi:hypothetical protein